MAGLTVNDNINLTSGEMSNVNWIRFNNTEAAAATSPNNGFVGYDLNFFSVGDAGNPEFIDIIT